MLAFNGERFFSAQLTFWLLTFSACSGPRVEIQQKNLSPTQWAKESVINLLNASTTLQIDRVLTRSEKRASEDRINMSSFWDLMSERSDGANLVKLNAEEHLRLLNFHRQDCREESFRAFAGFVLKTQRADYLKYLTEEASCTSSLGPYLTARVVTFWAQKRRNNAANIQILSEESSTQFLIKEIAKSPAVDWSETFRSVPNESWPGMLQGLSAKKNFSALRILFQAQKNGNLKILSLRDYAGALAEDSQLLSAAIEDMGYSAALQTLSEIPTWRWQTMAPEKFDSIFKLLFAQWSDRFDQSKQIEERLYLISAYEQLMILSAQWISAEKSLSRVLQENEILLRRLEKKVLGLDIVTRQDFLERSDALSPWTARWLALRVLSENEGALLRQSMIQEILGADASVPEGVFNKIAHLRSQIRVVPEEKTKRLLIHQLCDFYAQNKLARHTFESIEDWIHGVKEPGCFTIKQPADKKALEFRRSNLNFEMAFDHVLQSQGASMDLEYARGDLSVIDLSQDKSPEEFRIGERDRELDALIAPFVFSMEIPNSAGKTDVQMFVAHVTLKAPRTAPTDWITLKDGFDGGRLKLASAAPAPERIGKTFVFVSAGGQPQQLAKLPESGRGDSSQLDILKLQEWIHRVQDPKGRAVYLANFLTFSDWKSLLDHAVRQTNASPILIDSQYVEILSPAQKAKLDKYCGMLDLNDCIEQKLAPLIWKTVQTSVDRTSPDPDNEFPPRLHPERKFVENAASAAPNPAPGKNGRSGSLVLE